MTLPDINNPALSTSRDAIHAYTRVLGGWAKKLRLKRKHWWQISLRTSLRGLSTGVLYADPDFEIELDLQQSRLLVSLSNGQVHIESLSGQAPAMLAENIKSYLGDNGVDTSLAPEISEEMNVDHPAYTRTGSELIFDVLRYVAAQMEIFRASIREETSPIQLWPHHFDLSMLWLPGSRIPDQDPDNEEYADKQMNFGFTFGDATIPEPYFYITAYPLPESFPALKLPAGTRWYTESFNGAVLLYKDLMNQQEPDHYLQQLWGTLLAAGHDTLMD
jgi:hypothetical protein